MRDFVRTLGLRQKVLSTGFVIAASRLGFHTPHLAGIGRLLNISSTFTIRIVGAEELSS